MSNVPATQTGGAVANPDDYNPYAAYGEQATGGARNIIKFRKGRFFYGQDDIEIPLGTRMIANMAEAKVGWVRWWDGRPTDEVMVLIGDGVAPPRRGELGDDDRARWETDDRGDPRDPCSSPITCRSKVRRPAMASCSPPTPAAVSGPSERSPRPTARPTGRSPASCP